MAPDQNDFGVGDVVTINYVRRNHDDPMRRWIKEAHQVNPQVLAYVMATKAMSPRKPGAPHKPNPPRRGAWLHPTKGWRGAFTRPTKSGRRKKTRSW